MANPLRRIAGFLSRSKKEEVNVEKPKRNIVSLVFGNEGGRPSTEISTEQLDRKAKTDLERIYFLDKAIFAGINLIASQVTASGYILEDASEKSVERVNDFIKKINLIPKLTTIVEHQCIFGEGIGEMLYNPTASKVVDMITVDPKSMEFIKNSEGVPVLDDDGNYQFIWENAFGKKKRLTEKELPKGHYPKIIYFPLHQISSGQRGIGLIEPLYKTEQIKLNLEHAVGEVGYRLGLPIIWAKLGDEFNIPTDDQLVKFGESIKELHHSNQIVTPNYAEIQLLQPEAMDGLQDILNYFKKEVAAGLGVPLFMLYGSGEEMNKATATALINQFYRNILTYQERVSMQVQPLINRFCELEKIKDIPRFRFKDPRLESLDAFADRMKIWTETGLVPPTRTDEIFVREREGLPPKEEKEEEVVEEEKKSVFEPLKEGKLPEPLPAVAGIENDLADFIYNMDMNVMKWGKELVRKAL